MQLAKTRQTRHQAKIALIYLFIIYSTLHRQQQATGIQMLPQTSLATFFVSDDSDAEASICHIC